MKEDKYDCDRELRKDYHPAREFLEVHFQSRFVKETVDVTEDNADCSVVIRGTVRESALPFPVHANQKARLTLINFNV